MATPETTPEIKHSSEKSEELNVLGKTNQKVKNLKIEVKSKEDRAPSRLKELINKKEAIDDESIFELFMALYPLSDLNSWDEMVSVCERTYGDTRLIVLPIQIILKKHGYKINKLDGLLKNKGSYSSETMEAVKLFQKENGI